MTASQLQSSIPWSAFSSWKIPCRWRTLPALSQSTQPWFPWWVSYEQMSRYCIVARTKSGKLVGVSVCMSQYRSTCILTLQLKWKYDSFSTIQCLELAAATYVFFFKNQHPTNQNLHNDISMPMTQLSVSPSQGARFLFQIHAADETPAGGWRNTISTKRDAIDQPLWLHKFDKEKLTSHHSHWKNEHVDCSKDLVEGSQGHYREKKLKLRKLRRSTAKRLSR